MNSLLKSLITLGLLLVVSASVWAALPESNGSPCERETVKAQFKDSETRLHKASTTLFYQSFAPHPNLTAVQEAKPL